MNKALTWSSFAILLILAFMWGSSFTFIKIALEAFGPLTIAAGRITLAALILLGVAFVRRDLWPSDRTSWFFLFALAILGNALPFFLIGWGEQNVDGGMTAVLMSVIPLTVPIMAHYFTHDEKLTPFMVLGVLIGFAGLLVLVGPGALSGLGDDLISQGAIVAAALCYGSASIVARKLSHLPLSIVAAASVSMAAFIILPMAFIFEAPFEVRLGISTIGAVIYLGLFPTALANILLFKVIKTSGASFLALNNYLVPVFGVAIASLTLGENIPPEMLTALVVIFVGIFVSNLKRKSG